MQNRIEALIDDYMKHYGVTAVEAGDIIMQDLDTALEARAPQASEGEQP